MKTLKIKGEEYPFRLELGAMRLYAIKQGIKKIKTKDLVDIIQEADIISDYPVLIWAGLKAGPKPDDDRFDHTPEEVAEWLEDDPSALDRAMDMVNEDVATPEPPEDLPEGNAQEASESS